MHIWTDGQKDRWTDGLTVAIAISPSFFFKKSVGIISKQNKTNLL